MALIENDLFEGTVDKVKIAIERLRMFEPEALRKHPEGYYVGDSGGKDSCVIVRLSEMANVKHRAYHNLTTIDPPEIIHFIREHHPDTVIEKPKVPFFTEMVKRGFPMRQARWCCGDYKERGGHDRLIVTGVRWDESARRKNSRRMNETCYKDKTKNYLNVIIDWTDQDVWDFIKQYNVPYCKLYDENFKRLGCVMCPLASKTVRLKEMERFPKIANSWKRAFDKFYERKKAEGSPAISRWKNSDEMFNWWMTSQKGKDHPDQTIMFE